MIYGNVFLPKEYDIRPFTESEVEYIVNYINEHNTIVLNERVFSKKELQDPEMLKKMLNQLEKTKEIGTIIFLISSLLSVAEAIAIGVVTKNVLLGVGSFLPIITSKAVIALKLNDFISKDNLKKIKQLREQSEKLKEKCSQSNDDKSKETVRNCNELIKKIDKYLGKVESNEYKKKYNNCKFVYNTVITGNFTCRPSNDYAYMIKKLKLSKQDINNNAKKAGTKTHIWDLYGCSTKEAIEKESGESVEDFAKNAGIPELKDNGIIYSFTYHADWLLLYSPKADAFFYGYNEYYRPKKYSNITDIPGFGKDSSNKYNVPDYLSDDILKAVDADLGYYRLSEPPKGVKPKNII